MIYIPLKSEIGFTLNNCGIGSGGFQSGNKCAKGGGSNTPTSMQRARWFVNARQRKVKRLQKEGKSDEYIEFTLKQDLISAAKSMKIDWRELVHHLEVAGEIEAEHEIRIGKKNKGSLD